MNLANVESLSLGGKALTSLSLNGRDIWKKKGGSSGVEWIDNFVQISKFTNVDKLKEINNVTEGKFYCQNGLSLMHDGEMFCSSSQWRDVIGERDIALNGSAQYTGKGISRLNNDTWYLGTMPSLSVPDNYTAEAVFVKDSNSPNRQVLYIIKNQYAFMFSDNWMKFYGSSSCLCKLVTYGTVYSMSVVVENGVVTKLYCNGEEVTTTYSNSINYGTGNFMMGSNRASSTAFQGTLFGARLYNRVLSPEEMIANEEVDLLRFGQ